MTYYSIDLDQIKLELGSSYDYFAGGAGDEISLRNNVKAWKKYKLLPKNLVDVSSIDISVDLLDKKRSHPIIVAPMAYQKHAHSEGEKGTAHAAALTNTIFTLSTQSTTPLSVISQVPHSSEQWFQLYVFKDRELSYSLVDEACALGFEAVVMTIDFPVGGWRERDKKSGFSVKYPVAINPNGQPLTPKQLHDLHDPTMTWDDVEKFIARCPLPVILKGILRKEEALRAFEIGAKGIVVSNHGARQLDTTPAPISVLEEIVNHVRNSNFQSGDIIVDGGIRRGWSVAKALSLGANSVMIGRPILWGLSQEGSAGAQNVLLQFIAEFENTLGLLGCPNAKDLNKSFLA